MSNVKKASVQRRKNAKLHTALHSKKIYNSSNIKYLSPQEQALAKALQNKWIFGAGLDVYENEPEINKNLLKLDNVVLQPHSASATTETRTKMAIISAENMIAGLKGKIPDNCINPEIFKN